MVDRRNFLAAAAAAAMGSAEAAPQLAVSGGTAVRSKPLGGPNWGPQYYDGKEQRQLEEVLESRNPFRFSNPLNRSKVALFENECAARMQTKHALAVTSGTAALHVAMAALEVGPGDEVILPAWTWYSCYTTVIMAVHLQGNPAYLDPILAIARQHGLKVLEDASQSVGASYQGKPLGSMGDIGIYSLQQSKTITAGEGGLLVTSDPYLFERACRFHDVTVRKDFPPKLGFIPGLNYRMNEFTGGVLLAQLRKLDTIIGDVRRNARRVYGGIRDLEFLRWRHLPDPEGELGTGIFLGFRTKEERQRYADAMMAEGVPVSSPGGSVILPIVPEIER